MGEEKGGGWSNVEQVNSKRKIPKSMNVPQMRRDILTKQNVSWLLRNLGVNNSSHPDFNETIRMLKKGQQNNALSIRRQEHIWYSQGGGIL